MSRPRTYDYAQVAEVYVEAAISGFPPTKSVQQTYGISYRAAANLVARARRLGYLTATTKGAKVGIPAKVAAVADAVGVDPVALHEAILVHAGGDLRISHRPTRPGR